MQGFAFKTVIVTAVLFSMSWAFAATEMPAAGCMGCHQGETMVMSDNETANKNQSKQQSQKQNLLQHNQQEAISS